MTNWTEFCAKMNILPCLDFMNFNFRQLVANWKCILTFFSHIHLVFGFMKEECAGNSSEGSWFVYNSELCKLCKK